MNIDPEFLTLEDVLAIHEEQIAFFGGMNGIRERSLLESAGCRAAIGFWWRVASQQPL